MNSTRYFVACSLEDGSSYYTEFFVLKELPPEAEKTMYERELEFAKDRIAKLIVDELEFSVIKVRE